MKLQQVSTSYKDENDVSSLFLIKKVGRRGRKGGPKRVQKSKEEE